MTSYSHRDYPNIYEQRALRKTPADFMACMPEQERCAWASLSQREFESLAQWLELKDAGTYPVPAQPPDTSD